MNGRVMIEGSEHWFKNGKLHREDGPAVIHPCGSNSWWLNGVYHRDGGPAIVNANGRKEWWTHGVIRQEICTDGEVFYYDKRGRIIY